jgi:hypothetical protein
LGCRVERRLRLELLRAIVNKAAHPHPHSHTLTSSEGALMPSSPSSAGNALAARSNSSKSPAPLMLWTGTGAGAGSPKSSSSAGKLVPPIGADEGAPGENVSSRSGKAAAARSNSSIVVVSCVSNGDHVDQAPGGRFSAWWLRAFTCLSKRVRCCFTIQASTIPGAVSDQLQNTSYIALYA